MIDHEAVQGPELCTSPWRGMVRGLKGATARFLMFLALAFFAPVRPGIAGDAIGDAACHILADRSLYGHEYEPASVGQCNANEHCWDVRRLIEQHHLKMIPDLTCPGVRQSSRQSTAKFASHIYNDACSPAAIYIADGNGEVGDLQQQLAICNQYADKSACEEQKQFLRSYGRDPRGLTCE